MRDPMTPIQAGEGEAASFCLCGAEIDSEIAQELFSGAGQLVLAILFPNVILLLQAIANGDAQFSGEMVVAGAGEDKFGGTVLGDAAARDLAVGGGRQRFQGDSYQW